MLRLSVFFNTPTGHVKKKKRRLLRWKDEIKGSNELMKVEKWKSCHLMGLKGILKGILE
jgi:hypothetical protein